MPPGPDAQDVPDVSPADDASSSRTVGESAADTAADTAAPKAKKRPASTKRPATTAKQPQQPVVLRASGLVKRYGQTLAVDEVDLEIRQGSIFGVVGPNGAGKTTTLSIVTGLLRPDAGSVTVLDHDVWADPTAAKRDLGVLPDRLRLFDRLTGAQLLYYSATLRGLDGATARKRSADLAEAFGLGEALGRQVADYSVGMAKKIALAATLIHSPRVLVLDEPFESVDPVSAATITEILRRYTRGGGTVVLSSHSMELVQRTCDSVAIIVGGRVLASGTMAQVRGRKSLEDKFVELAGGRVVAESMEWLHSFSG
nr:ABC transporter ATP-binding protein [Curtobacterium flaccumfaciens]